MPFLQFNQKYASAFLFSLCYHTFIWGVNNETLLKVTLNPIFYNSSNFPSPKLHFTLYVKIYFSILFFVTCYTCHWVGKTRWPPQLFFDFFSSFFKTLLLCYSHSSQHLKRIYYYKRLLDKSVFGGCMSVRALAWWPIFTFSSLYLMQL